MIYNGWGRCSLGNGLLWGFGLFSGNSGSHADQPGCFQADKDPEQVIVLSKVRQGVILPENYVRFFSASPVLKWDKRSKLIKTSAQPEST